MGSLRVKVLSATGAMLADFDPDSNEPTRANHVRHAVKWSRRDWTDTRPPIRLRFHLDNARLQSYRIRTGDTST